MNKRLAFVVQRYGLEVNGGAETLARQLVEHLNEKYTVEVLTTKAIEYTTWEDYYKEDVEQINGITVRRFSVKEPRNVKKFSKFCGKVLDHPDHTMDQENEWFDMQGPKTPGLIEFIEQHESEYDAFIFMTYLYYTTVKGLPKVAKKAILIPTAHDEPPIYLKTFEQIFTIPKALYYLTKEEQQFVEKKFHNANIINNHGHGGSGIEVPDKTDPNRMAREYGITDYIVYAGRIDSSKGCVELFKYFLKYKRHNKNNVKLVLMGKPVIRIPKNKNIISLGFVSEEEKYDVMAGAKLLVMPSAFESLSIVVLEALALSVPVLCNGRCEVLKGHCERSHAGLYYHDYKEFEVRLNKMLDFHEERRHMGEDGVKYVHQYYTWDKIMESFGRVFDQVFEDAPQGSESDRSNYEKIPD